MIRLYVVVEGQTEEAFVKGVLRPYLMNRSIWAEPIIVSTSRATGGQKRKGGGYWRHWRKDIERVLSEQATREAWVTTMFDLYGLPRDFPALREIGRMRTGSEKVQRAESAVKHSTAALRGSRRLIPYVQLHEFEALVLASLDSLQMLLDAPDDLAGIEALKQEISGLPPEDVNDGPETAPSKRLVRRVPSYDKVLHGELALEDATIPSLAKSCPHFRAWVDRLVALGGTKDEE